MKYRVSRVLAGPILHLLWRPQVIGGERIPATGGAILASNHLSLVDSIFLPLMLARPVTFAAKSEYFTGKRPGQRIAAAYMRATSQLSVDRAGARAAQETLQAALGLLQAGELFGIYPEGTRSPDGQASTVAGPGSAGWHWPRACRSFRWPWSAPTGCWRPARPSRPCTGSASGWASRSHSSNTGITARGPGPQGSHRRGDEGHRRAVRAGVRADVRVGPQGGVVHTVGRAGPLSARPGRTPGRLPTGRGLCPQRAAWWLTRRRRDRCAKPGKRGQATKIEEPAAGHDVHIVTTSAAKTTKTGDARPAAQVKNKASPGRPRAAGCRFPVPAGTSGTRLPGRYAAAWPGSSRCRRPGLTGGRTAGPHRNPRRGSSSCCPPGRRHPCSLRSGCSARWPSRAPPAHVLVPRGLLAASSRAAGGGAARRPTLRP